MKSYLKLTIWALLPFLIFSCSTNGIKDYPKLGDDAYIQGLISKNKAQEIPQFKSIPGSLAPGFSYKLHHNVDDKLKGVFTTDINGVLRLPYKIRINTTGMTFVELRKAVLKKYGRFFRVGSENVRFSLFKRRYWIQVRGLVKKSGRFLVKRNESLDKVLNFAGGISGNINSDYFAADLQQKGKKFSIILNQYYQENSFGKSIQWQGGDEIFIKKVDLQADEMTAPFITIVGGVNKPGKTLFQGKANLFYYLEKSGGLLAGINYDETYVFRRNGNKLDKIQFNLTDTKNIPLIKPGDVIYLNSDFRTIGDRWLDRFSRIASLLSTVAIIVIAL